METQKKRVSVGKRWCFTAYNETDTLVTLFKSDEKIKWIVGRELCPTTGRAHGQGYIECGDRIRPMERFGTKDTHWEKAKGSKEDNIEYCSKDGDFETNFEIRQGVIDPLAKLEPYGWQKRVIDIVKGEVDNRKIYWFWESEGCKGKSTLAKHICMNYKALCVGGKGNDIKFAVYSYLETRDLDVLIYDIPRSIGNIVSYSSIEEIKNGCMFNNKYESGMKVFNPPHIIIFSNYEPNMRELSRDRWEVIEIDGL